MPFASLMAVSDPPPFGMVAAAAKWPGAIFGTGACCADTGPLVPGAQFPSGDVGWAVGLAVGFAVGFTVGAADGEGVDEGVAETEGSAVEAADGCSLGEGSVVAAAEAVATTPGDVPDDPPGAVLVQALSAMHKASSEKRDEQKIRDFAFSAGRNIATLPA